MVYQRFSAIARKEVIQILRDSRSLLIVLSMPLLLMALLGYGISLDQKNVPTCVFDREGSQKSQDLLKRFQASPYFQIEAVNHTYRDLLNAIDSGSCRLGVVVPHNFSERLKKGQTAAVQGIVDATDDNTANLIFGYAQAVITSYSSEIQVDFMRRQGQTRIDVTPVSVDARTWFNEDLDSTNFIVPGVVVIVMAVIGTFLTALTVAREWERGTMEQLISTPATPAEITLGKLVPYFAIGLADTAVCTLIAVFWFQVPFRGTVELMFIASTMFLTVVLLLGYWISVTTKSQLAASQFSLILTFLPSFLLSGFAFPLDQTPIAVQVISYLTPARYYVTLLKDIFLKGSSVASMMPQLGGLAIFAGLVSFWALRAFSKKLE